MRFYVSITILSILAVFLAAGCAKETALHSSESRRDDGLATVGFIVSTALSYAVISLFQPFTFADDATNNSSEDGLLTEMEFMTENATNVEHGYVQPYCPGPGGRWPAYGCHKGYCWANCRALSIHPFSPEWCYTTKGAHSQSYDYTKCTYDFECCRHWKCAGPCTFF